MSFANRGEDHVNCIYIPNKVGNLHESRNLDGLTGYLN